MGNESTEMKDTLTLKLFGPDGKLKDSNQEIKQSPLIRFLQAYKRWLLT